jgi:hypothetical protein
MFFSKRLIFLFAIIIPLSLHSQVIPEPNYGLKSHETLTIEKVELRRDATIISFSIENKIEGGAFCIDRRTYIVDPSGNRYRMIRATGIPLCPTNHNFTAPGDTLAFQLTFPPLAGNPAYIDIREECTEHCFSFYGLTLDEYINSRFDEPFSMLRRGDITRAIGRFEAVSEIVANHSGLSALALYNIVKLSHDAGDEEKAAEWYQKLNTMRQAIGKVYIEQLNLQGITY